MSQAEKDLIAEADRILGYTNLDPAVIRASLRRVRDALESRLDAEVGEEIIKAWLERWDFLPTTEEPWCEHGDLIQATTEAVHIIHQLLRERDEARTLNELHLTWWKKAESRVKELWEENFQLAAWQCPFKDGKKGLTSDEYGNQSCAMEARVKELGDMNEQLYESSMELLKHHIENLPSEEKKEVQDRFRELFKRLGA